MNCIVRKANIFLPFPGAEPGVSEPMRGTTQGDWPHEHASLGERSL